MPELKEYNFKEKYFILGLMAMLWYNNIPIDQRYDIFGNAFGHYTDFRFPDSSHVIYLMSIHGDNLRLNGFPKPPCRYFTCSPDQFFESEFIPFIKSNP